MDRRLKEDISTLSNMIEDYKYYSDSKYVLTLKRVIYCLEHAECYLSDMEAELIEVENEADNLLEELKIALECYPDATDDHTVTLREDVVVIGLGDPGINFIKRNIFRGLFPRERCIAISRDKSKLAEAEAGETIHLVYDERFARFEQRRAASAMVMKRSEAEIQLAVKKMNCKRLALVFGTGSIYADAVFPLIKSLRTIGIAEVYPFAYLPFKFEPDERLINSRTVYDRLAKVYEGFYVDNNESLNDASRRMTMNEAMDLLDYNMLGKFRACTLI